jgi:hypothetical protein
MSCLLFVKVTRLKNSILPIPIRLRSQTASAYSSNDGIQFLVEIAPAGSLFGKTTDVRFVAALQI